MKKRLNHELATLAVVSCAQKLNELFFYNTEELSIGEAFAESVRIAELQETLLDVQRALRVYRTQVHASARAHMRRHRFLRSLRSLFL